MFEMIKNPIKKKETSCFVLFLKKDFIYFQREGVGGAKAGKHLCVRETWISCVLHVPYQGPGPQPRHVP